MNIAYFRKSKYSLSDTIKNLIKNAEIYGWKNLGETTFGKNSGKMILICRPDWIKTILDKNHKLIGFLPCAISIFEKNGDILIGTGQPTLIKALAQNEDITNLATEAEKQIKNLIHKSAGVSEMKVASVKLYSTMTCPYCKMEQSWLENNKIKHDIIHVDLNPKAAQDMVEKTGQMGVPVTEITYDEGESEYIIGFDKPKLSQLLGIE